MRVIGLSLKPKTITYMNRYVNRTVPWGNECFRYDCTLGKVRAGYMKIDLLDFYYIKSDYSYLDVKLGQGKAVYSDRISVWIPDGQTIIRSFVCLYWQWQILINCVMSYYLCVLRWLMRPLSSKLPVADRTREVWGRKLCWWCLSSGFLLCTFLLGFADSFCFVFTSTRSYDASPLCSVLCPRLCWYVEVFKGGFEGVLVSRLLTTMGTCSSQAFQGGSSVMVYFVKVCLWMCVSITSFCFG